ncbi:MAG TPA: Asd/ArgC dimerization domain-containing protein [Thermoanaerobaculia bacterium]|nr:Asd/ArgC dimerization domain-containing protein [Thermoanaerobaculia bacterium]
MSRIAVLNPTSLLGKELVEAMEERRKLAAENLRLLSLDETEVGSLVEAAGAAALVLHAVPAEIEAADVVVVCGELERYRHLLEHRRPGSTLLVLDPAADPSDGVPVVEGVNLGAAATGASLVSPHPAVVLLALLLRPLAGFGLRAGVATMVQPVSLFGRPGLDELYEDARGIVALQGRQPGTLFHRQLAFNLYPAPQQPRGVAAQLRAVLAPEEAPGDVPGGGSPAVAVHVLQGGVFHGLSVLLHVHLDREVTAAELRAALGEQPLIELSEPEAAEEQADGREGGEDVVGPIDAAATAKVIVGRVEHDADGRPGSPAFWIWAVMDNLTRGGALNALAILERVA